MILVTGAAGYIGSQIVHQLYRLHDRPQVIGVDTMSAGYTCNLPKGFECIVGNAGDRAFMSHLIDSYKVKQIIHCAASVVVPDSVALPMDYYQNNVINSHALIETAIRKKVEGFVFSSSAAVYGQPEFNRPIQEDDATRPCSPYGWSKLMTEQMLKDAHVAHGMNTVILRYFNVAGADPLGQTGQTNPNATHLITKAVRAVVLRKPVPIFGDGTDVRDYVHVADVADANTLALEYTRRHNGCLTLNVGRGVGMSVMDVLHIVRAAVRRAKQAAVEFKDRREGDPVSIVANTRLIQQKFNWAPRYGLNDMVKDALKWEMTL